MCEFKSHCTTTNNMKNNNELEIEEDDEAVEISFRGETITVSDCWNCFRHCLGYGGMDVAGYIGGGMTIWPCGRTFQEGGRDGFKEDTGTDWCECGICQRVRSLIYSTN